MRSKGKRRTTKSPDYLEVKPDIIKNKFLPESDIIVKLIIEKLISLTISTSIKNKVEKQIPIKCFNYMKNVIKDRLLIEFLPHDIDDTQASKNSNELSINSKYFGPLNHSSEKDSDSQINSNSYIINKSKDFNNFNNSLVNIDQMFYNNSINGENNWDIMDEPKSNNYDRYSSSLVKYKEIEKKENILIKNKNKKGIKIDNLEEVKEEESLSKSNINNDSPNKRDSITNKKDLNINNISKTIYNIKRSSILLLDNVKKKRSIMDINQFPYEDIVDDDYHENDNEINYTQLRKELMELEEAKIKEEKRNKKKNKVIDIRQIIGENNTKYYGKNVTTDSNGNVVVIRAININKLKQDFTIPKTILKNIKQKNVKKIQNINNEDKNDLNKENNIIIKNDFETIDVDKRKEINNLIEQLSPLSIKSPEKRLLPKISQKKIKTPSVKTKTNDNEIKKIKREPILPSGSNFELINLEIGVSLKEDEKFKTGGKDFFKKFNKYSKEIYNKKLQESIAANSFLKTQTELLDEEKNKFKTETNFEYNYGGGGGENAMNSKYLMTSNNFGNSNYMSNVIGSYNANNINNLMAKTQSHLMNQSNQLNPSIKLSNISSLIGSLDKLTLISEREERLAKRNKNIFKRRKMKNLILDKYNEINQFTKEILKTNDWSNRLASKSEGKNMFIHGKRHEKPTNQELTREMGYITNKSIRSRSKVGPTLIDPALQTVAFFKQ